MKTYKNIGFGPRKGKKGFTLIELLIVMVILAILAGVIVMAVGGVFGSAKSAAYDGVSSQMGTAVGAYAAQNAGSYPLGAARASDIYDENGAVVNGSTLYIVDVALLLTGEDGMLTKAPDGCIAIAGDDTDNCDQSADIGGCLDTSHYLWLVDSATGVTYSVCTGALCGNTSADGYQEVWP